MHFQFFSESHLPALNRAVGDFVSERIWGEPGHFERYCSMGITDREGRLIAGIVYHNWSPDTGVIEISGGSVTRHWMTKDNLSALLSMPFNDLGCQAIVARHAEDKRHIRRIWVSLGAVEYVVPRLRGKHEPPEVISVLTDDAWAASPFNHNVREAA